MKFIIPVNEEVDENGKPASVTCLSVETESESRRVNKAKPKEVLVAWGVPVHEVKGVMKAMGFTGLGLGRTN